MADKNLGIWLAGILAMSLQTSCKYLDCIIFIAMWLQTLYRQLFLLRSRSVLVSLLQVRRANVRNELATSSHLRTRISPLCKLNCLLQVCSRLTAGLPQTFQFRKGISIALRTPLLVAHWYSPDQSKVERRPAVESLKTDFDVSNAFRF